MVGSENAVVVVVLIFLKHKSCCGRLANFYTKGAIPCTNFCAHKFTRVLKTW